MKQAANHDGLNHGLCRSALLMVGPVRLLRLTLLLALASALTGCFTVQLPEDYYRPRRTTLAADRVELPTVFVGDYPFVEVRINGAGPFRLMLDSGSSTLTLSPHVAKLAHVQINPFLTGPVAVNGGKGVAKHYNAQVSRVEAGGLKLEGVRALVPGKQAWATEVAGFQKAQIFFEIGDFDGILGLSVFFDLVLEIDYPNRRLAVMRSGTGRLPPDQAVPYDLARGVGFVTLDIGGKTERALIDTGSNGGFHLATIDDVPLLYPKQKVDGLGGYGAGGQEARREWGQLAGDIRLGPITWQNAIVKSAHGEKAVIGSRALNPWKVVFDQRTRQLCLLGEHPLVAMKKTPGPDVRFKPGFFGELQGAGVRLLEVDSGGTFEQAGLRVGDVISTVDGFSAVDWASDRVPPEVLKKPRVKLNVEREGKKFEAILVQGLDGA